MTRQSLQGQPFLCFSGYSEYAHLAKILLCRSLKYSHHGKKCISARDDSTNAERYILSNSSYLVINGHELVAFRQRSCFTKVQENVQTIWADRISL